MKLLLKGGRVWMNRRFLDSCPVLIGGDRILSVGQTADADTVIDASGMMILPGLVDVHTHGRAGHDFSTATEAEMLEMKADYARHGVTALFPTLASATPAEWHSAIHRVQSCGFDGIHLEGRWLNPAKRGAHAPELLAELSAADLESYLREIKIPCHVTAACELDRDGSFCASAIRFGATLGLGHTAATAAETLTAVSRGVTSFTHLFNAMPPLHHREGGAVCVALSDDGWTELIADGLHVSPEMVRFAYRCKGTERLVLITDSMEATGCPDGSYSIAGQPVLVKNGRAETLDGALAGSTLNLWDGVRNLTRFAGIPLPDAIACATINPAKMVGIDRKVGSIETGKRADLLMIDSERSIRAVFAAGQKLPD